MMESSTPPKTNGWRAPKWRFGSDNCPFQTGDFQVPAVGFSGVYPLEYDKGPGDTFKKTIIFGIHVSSRECRNFGPFRNANFIWYFIGKMVGKNPWKAGPLIINPMYTLYSRYLFGISPFKGLFGGLKQLQHFPYEYLVKPNYHLESPV